MVYDIEAVKGWRWVVERPRGERKETGSVIGSWCVSCTLLVRGIIEVKV